MSLLKKLIDLLTGKTEPVAPFAPLVFCPICATRTYWLEVSERWRCMEGHMFDVFDPRMPTQPPVRMPGDKGDNTDGEI